MSDALKYHEYFSGVSMASVALRPRWQCTFANDIDPIKAAVYRANWGHGITVADIASIRTSDLPPDEVDMSWVSFPCQDTSIAGAGAGLSGTRSGAFWGYARLTAQLKAEGRLPKLIVLENVTGLITSSGGADFVALCTALQDLGYRFGAIVVDALDFLPQSRPRIFIIAILRSLEIPARLVGSGPSAHFTPTALRRAVAGFPPELAADWIWWILPTPPPRNSQLIDLLVDKAPWDALSKTDALLGQLSPASRIEIAKARASGERVVAAAFRRTLANGPQYEARFDGVAGCFRVASGGSSRQLLIAVEGPLTQSRLITAREAARLMGPSDTFVLPANTNDALSAIGDGVAVPVVRFLSENLLLPLLHEGPNGAVYPVPHRPRIEGFQAEGSVEMTDKAGKKIASSDSPPEVETDADGIPPEVAEELDADEAEFRALRRDVEGVKGAGAIGMVTIAVAKVPGKNEFFRTCPDFKAVVPIVNHEVGMDKHYYAVTPDMVTALASIGISVTDHTLYLTCTSRDAVTIVPVRCAGPDGQRNEFDRTKEIGLLQGLDAWVRLYVDQENRCYQVFPAPAERFSDPLWPKLKPAKIFKLAFRDKGRLVDSVEHALFKQWAARDAG